MARQQPEIPNGIPPETKARLREARSWNEAACMVYAMRRRECATWAEVLFHAEQHQDCPRESSDAFIRTIAADLACVVADGLVDPDGILEAFRIAGSPQRVNGWYSRTDDSRAINARGRIVRNARYIQKLLRTARVTQRDLDVELRNSVAIAADRPTIRALLEKVSRTPQGRFDPDVFAQALAAYGITPGLLGGSGQSDAVRRPLAALRSAADEAVRAAADALRRGEAAAAEEAARAAALRATAEAASAAAPAPSRELMLPSAPEPEGRARRGYVRRERNLAPRTEPTVIPNPSPRDVMAYRFMERVLAVLIERRAWPVAFIPAAVMRLLGPMLFGNYSAPQVGVSQMRYKGYLTNVGSLHGYAVWRLEPVDVGEVVMSDDLPRLTDEDADLVVATAFVEAGAYAEALAAVTDEVCTPYHPVVRAGAAFDIDCVTNAASTGDCDSVEDADAGGAGDGADVQGVVDAPEAVVESPVVVAPPPPPVIDQTAIDTAVAETIARLVPAAVASEVADAVAATLTQTAERIARERMEHEARLAAMREELAHAERALRDVRLREEAAQLLRGAVAAMTSGKGRT